MLDFLVMLGIAVSIVIFVGDPLVRRRRQGSSDDTSASASAHLLLQKDTLYTAIRDLDFDFQTGKVDQQDYVELRQQLEREAVGVLRQIDASDPCVALAEDIERQIVLLRQRPTRTSPVSPAGSSRLRRKAAR